MENDLELNIAKLIKRAGDSDKSDDAMRFSQAACSVAHAIRLLDEIKSAPQSAGPRRVPAGVKF